MLIMIFIIEINPYTLWVLALYMLYMCLHADSSTRSIKKYFLAIKIPKRMLAKCVSILSFHMNAMKETKVYLFLSEMEAHRRCIYWLNVLPYLKDCFIY
jgi:hypothetical protein